MITKKETTKNIKKEKAVPVLNEKEKQNKSFTDKKNKFVSPVYDFVSKSSTNFVLPDTLFNVKAKNQLLSNYIRIYLSNQRQSSAMVQTRGEVSGSTKKIYKQKGTGRARHGARKAPIFVGGGVAHGPRIRNFSLKLNKKQKVKALLYALSCHASKQNIYSLSNYDEKLLNKTKQANSLLTDLNLAGKKICFVYNDNKDKNICIFFRNLPNITLCSYHNLNAYYVAISEKIIFTQNALLSFIDLRSKQE